MPNQLMPCFVGLWWQNCEKMPRKALKGLNKLCKNLRAEFVPQIPHGRGGSARHGRLPLTPKSDCSSAIMAAGSRERFIGMWATYRQTDPIHILTKP